MPSEETLARRRSVRRLAVTAGMILLAVAGGWLAFYQAPVVGIQITDVSVAPSTHGAAGRTKLVITTRYRNTGCTQILLARFLINARPASSLALPQQQGPDVLPPNKTEVVESVDLDFRLRKGHWHLFSTVVCYTNGEPVPAAVVSPTALFHQA